MLNCYDQGSQIINVVAAGSGLKQGVPLQQDSVSRMRITLSVVQRSHLCVLSQSSSGKTSCVKKKMPFLCTPVVNNLRSSLITVCI